MKAAVLTEPGRVEVTDLPDPGCAPDAVVVRVLGVGLCGTDLSVVRGDREVPAHPWPLGHEGVGEVVEVGSRVRHRRVGQRVAIEPNYCCLRCDACRRGLTSACPHRRSVGLTVHGLIAEHVAVPAPFAHPVADEVSLEDLVCAEPLTVARAAVRRSGVTAGRSCLVVGAGALGLFLCAALVAVGCPPRIREPDPERAALAVSLGALPDAPRETPVDHLFETSGVPAALEGGLDDLAAGGRATLLGIGTAPAALSTEKVVHRQLTVAGSFIYDHPDDFANTLRLIEDGVLALRAVLRAEYRPADVPAAFAAMAATPGKSWVRCGASW